MKSVATGPARSPSSTGSCAPDGSVRWVLERGQAQEAGDGRWWLDGAIFDVTARRAAEEALREHEVDRGAAGGGPRLAGAHPRGRRPRAPRHRAQPPRRRAAAPGLGRPGAAHLGRPARRPARGLPRAGPRRPRRAAAPASPSCATSPAASTRRCSSDHGLEHALRALAQRAAVPVELETALPDEPLPMAVEAAAYFAVSEALTNVAQVRRGEPRVGPRRAAATGIARRDRPGRRRRRRGAGRRHGPAGPARPPRRPRRDARDRQPAGRRHDAARAAAA